MRESKSESNNYEKDFYKWAMTQADLLKHGKFEKVDLENVIEEIEDLGISQRSALDSQMTRLLMHMLKVDYQPSKHTKSWDRSVFQARMKIQKIVKKNPSLKRELEKTKEEAFPYARKEAAFETGIDIKHFPKECPWTLKEILGEAM